MTPRSALSILLAVGVLACEDPVRSPLWPRRLDSATAPPVRPAFHGAHVFVVFDDARMNDRYAVFGALPWPEHAVAPRTMSVLAHCAAGPGLSLNIDFAGWHPGDRFSADIDWEKLCPGEPAPERASIALQLTDVCVRDECETIAGTLDLQRRIDPWPAR